MEPGDRAAQTVITADVRDERMVRRFRLAAASAVLVALAFVQAPGRIVGDTKADLAIDPGAFLARALDLWDPNGSFGQVQNQAYGYLFPMGPFFWFGDLVGLEPWVVQRLWWALILVVAFLGVVKTCQILGIGSFSTQVIGGFAYALSPRMLSTMGPASIEIWPMALAPWVLIPLVIGLQRGNPRFYAALSALAVACVGGVNAAATLAVIPLGALWLLMAEPSRRRRTLIVWWPLFVLLGTVWWVVPLLLMALVSPPFLDFIESAATTTLAANPFDALRGTTHWVPYVDGGSGAGRQLITDPILVAHGVVVLAFGLIGLCLLQGQLRRLLVSGLMLGLVLVSMGHGTGLFDEGLRTVLDGAFAPLRNAHKFDPLIRLPLVLGLVHAASVLIRTARDARDESASHATRLFDHGIVVLAAAAVLGAATPALVGAIPHDGSYEEVPEYWRDAAAWLEENAEGQNTLVVPASAFGDYLWGSPRDEVIQTLAATPWSVRNVIPLAPPGQIRMLDALERALASGDSTTALSASLRRSQIRYLMVRTDLAAADTTSPTRVRSTLDSTEGVRRVAAFGPVIGTPTTLQSPEGETLFFEAGLAARGRVIEIYEVADVDMSDAAATRLDDVPVVVGEAGGLLNLADEISPDLPVVLAADVPRDWTPGSWYLTDSLRRQEVSFGRVTQNRSATLGADEAFRTDRRVHDYLRASDERWLTTRQTDGVARIEASSSASDARGGRSIPGRHPAAAFDRDAATAWSPSSDAAETTPWLEVILLEPLEVTELDVQLTPFQRERRVRIVTDQGSVEHRVPAGELVTLPLPAGATTSVRLEFPGSPRGLAVDEVRIPGVDVTSPLRLPDAPATWGIPRQIRLAVADESSECYEVSNVRRCRGGGEVLGEDGTVLDRIVPLPLGFTAQSAVTAVPRNTPELTAALTRDDGFAVEVSSSATFGPTHGALAMLDDRPETGWIGGVEAERTWIEIVWDEPRAVSDLVLRTDDSLAASSPRRATVTFDDGTSVDVTLDDDGEADFEEVRTRSVRIDVTALTVRSTIDENGLVTALPVGVSDLDFPTGGSSLGASAAQETALPCGSGPTVVVDGTFLETAVTTDRRDVVDEKPVVAQACDDAVATFSGGDNRVTVASSDHFRPRGVVFEPTGETGTPQATVAPGRVVSATGHTVNQGWSAPEAQPVTVDGWRQGWVSGPDTVVEPRYGLQGVYRGALAVGAVAAVALVLAALLLRRRESPEATVADRPRSRWRRILGTGAMVLAFASLTGVVGLLVAAGAALAALMLPARDLRIAWAMALALPAALAAALLPFGSTWGWAGQIVWTQGLLVASLAVVVVIAFDLTPRERSRREGASMRR